MESKSAVIALGALAQDTRLAIFRLLVTAGESGLSVGRIAEDVEAAPATLSFHLKELVHAGLIAPRQEGRFIFYAANYDAMNELVAFLTENCCAGDGGTCRPAACKPRRTLPAKKKPIAKRAAAGTRSQAKGSPRR